MEQITSADGTDTATPKVIAIMSMSLDGYVADGNDGVAEVFDWYMSGEVEVPTTSSDFTFHVSAASAGHLRALMSEIGAMLTGRRTFDAADGWGGQHPWGIPAFVVTHRVPDGWPRRGSTVHFVTEGLESAVAQAKSAAGDRAVGVHGGETIRQCLEAGLLDEIQIDLAPVVLGSGIPMFDGLHNAPVILGNPTVVAGVGVTHLRYPVHTT
jgi:dihydrofolate reductase